MGDQGFVKMVARVAKCVGWTLDGSFLTHRPSLYPIRLAHRLVPVTWNLGKPVGGDGCSFVAGGADETEGTLYLLRSSKQSHPMQRSQQPPPYL